MHCRCQLESVEALEGYLKRREPFLLHKTNTDSAAAVCSVRYQEPVTADLWKWGGGAPQVQITYDRRHAELLGICLWVDRSRNSEPECGLVRTLLKVSSSTHTQVSSSWLSLNVGRRAGLCAHSIYKDVCMHVGVSVCIYVCMCAFV